MSDDNKIPSRVSITYSVDLIEVPERVKILMNELANSFGGVAKLCRESAGKMSEDPVAGTKMMADLRSLISKTQIRVEDCIEIMIGYVKILQSIPPSEDSVELEEEQPEVVTEPEEEKTPPPETKKQKPKGGKKKKTTKKKEKK